MQRADTKEKQASRNRLGGTLVASVAQLVEQLTLNFRTGFFRFSLVFAPIENSYTSARSHFSCCLALTHFRSK